MIIISVIGVSLTVLISILYCNLVLAREASKKAVSLQLRVYSLFGPVLLAALAVVFWHEESLHTVAGATAGAAAFVMYRIVRMFLFSGVARQ